MVAVAALSAAAHVLVGAADLAAVVLVPRAVAVALRLLQDRPRLAAVSGERELRRCRGRYRLKIVK